MQVGERKDTEVGWKLWVTGYSFGTEGSKLRHAVRSEGKANIECGRGIHVQADAGLLVRVEAARRHFDAIEADGNLAEEIPAVRLRFDRALEACLDADELDMRGGNDGATRIGNGSGHGRGGCDLCNQRARREKKYRKQTWHE